MTAEPGARTRRRSRRTGRTAKTTIVPINANERIAMLTKWLESAKPLPPGVSWEWTGDQEEQAESGAFLMKAFAGRWG